MLWRSAQAARNAHGLLVWFVLMRIRKDVARAWPVFPFYQAGLSSRLLHFVCVILHTCKIDFLSDCGLDVKDLWCLSL